MKKRSGRKLIINIAILMIVINSIIAIKSFIEMLSIRKMYQYKVLFGNQMLEITDQIDDLTAAVAFGRSCIDLRAAQLTHGATIDLYANYGFVRVIVPEHWVVRSKGSALMGSFVNHARGEGTDEERPTLYIRYHVRYAGVKVERD